MENEKPEFFKLDAIDREVLLWTITHAPRSLHSWIDYIAAEYKKKSIIIDREKLYNEAQENIENISHQ